MATKVFKFGGASVKDADGIRNLARIVSMEKTEHLLVVVSAMGKTTNALESILDAQLRGDDNAAAAQWAALMQYHVSVLTALGLSADILPLSDMPASANPDCYDMSYDQLVSWGELLSTTIVNAYLRKVGVDSAWLDMTHLLRTDATYRDANVDMESSAAALQAAVRQTDKQVLVVQGFIGGTSEGKRTTLGREGSDYTAALLGNFLNAESVTIWKDVPGILNADPRLVEHTVLIPELSYNDAVELSYSGAQIIHPKTIRPLENKHIPLYVKPFAEPTAAGSVISAEVKRPIQVPVYIWRKNQILITMRAKDFAFVLEESLSCIFDCIRHHRLRVSLIQSSAVTISVCVDSSRYVEEAIRQLSKDYLVTYNEGLSLLTIRGTTPEIIAHETQGRTILLSQTTRRTARFVMRENN
ncbi:MAG: aspartate kinase [Paludibacteraceae bacterium]